MKIPVATALFFLLPTLCAEGPARLGTLTGTDKAGCSQDWLPYNRRG